MLESKRVHNRVEAMRTAARKLRESLSCRCDAAEVLELIEEALDEVAMAVEGGIDSALHLAIAGGRDVGASARAATRSRSALAS